MSNNNKAAFYNESKINNRNNKANSSVEKSLCSETTPLTSGPGLDSSDDTLDRNVNASSLGNEQGEEAQGGDGGDVTEAGAMASEGFNYNLNNSKNQEDSSWLTMKLCNNNLLSKLADYENAHQPGPEYADKFWDSMLTKHSKIEIEENSKILANSSSAPNQQNQEVISSEKFSDEDKENACSSAKGVDLDYEFAMAAAAGPIYSPPNNSNHTSLNNSTENLSYEDMLLLENDAVESEASINSDDCVYAYRGNADELEFAILNTRRVKGPDDETEFLEMDYEPDPLSEVEYADLNSTRADLLQPHSNALLLQRDSCHINSNGRQSAISLRHTPTMGQRLLSSPTEELPVPINSLQTQAMLSKNFARISLHLDQIKNDPNECNAFDLENIKGNANDNHLSAASALSLPSTLQTSGDESNQNEDDTQEYAKITGAKPKRLSRFSSTSSTSSKASTKSRNSLKSTFVPVQGGGDAVGPSTSSMKFDERSVSCNDFRSAPLASNNSTFQRKSHDSFVDQSSNDDNCLDCLEQEFLANTIGDKDDTIKNCSKCRKHRNNNDNNINQPNTKNQGIVDYRSDSPNYFLEYDYPRDEIYFDEYSPYTCIQYIGPERNIYAFDDEIDINFEPFRVGSIENGLINQRRRRDKLKKEQMLKNLTMTESEIKVSTLNLSEEVLVQALGKLQVSYNADLIKMYFKNLLFTKLPPNAKCFKNLYQFILYQSKKPCNHPKLKRLIETATKDKVSVEFKKDPNVKHQEMISIKVSDILAQWTKNKNLDVLKHFDKRFMETNIIGKVGNIIRQAQPHRSSSRRPLPEFISVPQFYPSGYLTLIKKC